MAVYGDGGLADGVACIAIAFFPSVYLNSSVKIVGGNGTSTDPYILELQEIYKKVSTRNSAFIMV